VKKTKGGAYKAVRAAERTLQGEKRKKEGYAPEKRRKRICKKTVDCQPCELWREGTHASKRRAKRESKHKMCVVRWGSTREGDSGIAPTGRGLYLEKKKEEDTEKLDESKRAARKPLEREEKKGVVGGARTSTRQFKVSSEHGWVGCCTFGGRLIAGGLAKGKSGKKEAGQISQKNNKGETGVGRKGKKKE